nr:MAG TPA: hypothetical protein [Caudoviricetes sp.]
MSTMTAVFLCYNDGSGVCVPSRFDGPTGRQSVRRSGRM